MPPISKSKPKPQPKPRGGTRASIATTETSNLAPPTVSKILVDGVEYDLVDIRATGDVILDVSFENTSACNKSIPSDALQKLRAAKAEIPSVRIFYRVRLETLKKHSKYFTQLLGSEVFGEGVALKKSFDRLADENLTPSELAPELLPQVAIIDDDEATRAYGREHVFGDMLRIIHGSDHVTRPITLTYLTVLTVLADRFDCLHSVSSYMTSVFLKFKYPQVLDKSGEDLLRQKCLIFYHSNQNQRFAEASRELILRGSVLWGSYDDSRDYSAAWWELPDGIEAELIHRRACILRIISHLQMHFVGLYNSRTRQCRLGYDSSASCDPFQLGEMIKFLSRKGLLTLSPFQAEMSEDSESEGSEVYIGEIEHLIGDLRAWPEYQIDKDHRHCGARVLILPALKHIKNCIDMGAGIKVTLWKTDRANHTWVIPKSAAGNGKRPFTVGDEVVGEDRRVFNFPLATSAMERGETFNGDKTAKHLFTAKKLIWTPEKEEESDRLRPNGLVFKF